jgi:hypothetical protein
MRSDTSTVIARQALDSLCNSLGPVHRRNQLTNQLTLLFLEARKTALGSKGEGGVDVINYHQHDHLKCSNHKLLLKYTSS